MKVFRLCFLFIAGVLAGCSAPQNAQPHTDRFMVTARSTPFYKYGPAQSNGADFMLANGQRVTLLKREFGYSQITTQNGQTGYVPTEDIGPAPAPSPTPKPEKPRRSRRSIYDEIPPPNFDEPRGLPLPETPAPSFRY